MLIRPQLVLMTVVVALSSRTGLGHPNEADAVGEALPVLKIPATTPSDAENPGRQNTPQEYLGPALPHEDTTAQGLLEHAREHFDAQEWSKGIDALDEVLSGETSQDSTETPSPEEESEDEQDNVDSGAAKIAQAMVAGGKAILRGVAWVQGKPVAPAAKASSKDTEKPPPLERSPVLANDGIHYVPVSARTLDLLLSIPTDAQDVYRQTFEPPARQLLDELREIPFAESMDGLEALFDRYPLSAAGLEALGLAARRALDLGLHARAAALHRRLVQVTDQLTEAGMETTARQSSALLARATFAFLRAGEHSRASQTLERLRTEHADDFFPVAGQPSSGRTFSTHELVAPRLVPPTFDPGSFRWSGPRGRVNHSALDLTEHTFPVLGARAHWVFRHEQSSETEIETKIDVQPPQPLRRSRPGQAFPAFQIASTRDRILFRSRSELVALDALTGKVEWRAMANLGRLNVPGTHSPDPSRGAYTLNLHTTKSGDEFVTLIDRPEILRYRNNKAQIASNQILAFDVATGKLRWRAGGPHASDLIRSITFLAPPTSAGDGVLVAPATRGDGACVVGLNDAGEALWITGLYDYNVNYMQRRSAQRSSGSSLAVSSGLAISSPGLGIVTAVDTQRGDVEWMTRYRVLPSNSSVRRWAPSEPIVSNQRVIVTPYDSEYLVVLDLETGKTLWDRSFGSAGDAGYLAGAGDELIYIVNDRVIGIELETGKTRFESDVIDRCAGKGFAAGSRLYLPVENGMVSVDTQNGEIIQSIGWRDIRTPGLRPGNLALVATQATPPPTVDSSSATAIRLVAFGSWGVALVQTLEESWSAIGTEGGRYVFERARLLWSQQRHDEALELLESLLKKSQTELSKQKARALLVNVARSASKDLNNAHYLDRVLDNHALELDSNLTTALQLEMARILETETPERAAQTFVDILSSTTPDELQRRVHTPDGVQARLGTYARDTLRALVFEYDQQPAGLDKLVRSTSTGHLGAFPITGASSDAVLRKILVRAPFSNNASRARALLVRRALDSGDLYAAHAHAERLVSDYPALRNVGRVRDLRNALTSRRVPAHATNALDPLLDPNLTDDTAWQERFWKGTNEGFLVETVDGSDAIPAVPVIHAGKLKLFDFQGKEWTEIELPEFPDVEKKKAALKAHLEEPARLALNGDRGILFTAAGVYELRFRETVVPVAADQTTGEKAIDDSVGNTKGDTEDAGKHEVDETQQENAATPTTKIEIEIGWHRTFPHAIEVLHNRARNRWNWGFFSSFSRVIFPEFLLGADQREGILVQTDGSVSGLDLETGKLLFRHESGDHDVALAPRVRGGRLLLPTTPPGLRVLPLQAFRESSMDTHYAFGGASSRRQSNTAILATPLIDDVAVVLDSTRGVEVHDAASRRVLWQLDVSHSAPIVARVDASQVWIANPNGRLESRSLQSGRLLWSLPIPRSCSWIGTIRSSASDTRGEAADLSQPSWLILSVNGRSPSIRSRQPFMRSGDALLFLKIDEVGNELARHQLAEHGHTYAGRYARREDTCLLALNQADSNDKWESVIRTLDLSTGETRPLLKRKIVGKGTGMAPRLARVRTANGIQAALALGNADGFGLFVLPTPAPPPPPEEASGDATTPKSDASGDPPQKSEPSTEQTSEDKAPPKQNAPEDT